MRALDRKLLRDLRLMWSQALTIAFVVAGGIAGFVTTLSAVDSLAQARDRFYADGRFADAFASVKRAPDALGERLRGIPGVADAQTTTEHTVRIELDNVNDPIVGQLIGVDARQASRMNLVSLRSGRAIHHDTAAGGDALEAWVSEGFARARGLRPGMRAVAQINGKRRVLNIVGIALSPEFIFAGFNGMPDIRGFGVFWVDRDALAAAYDMDGAFNRIAIKLAPGASTPAVLDTVSRMISPYGGREAYARVDQTSHRMLDNEIKEQRVLGSVLTAIFVVVAAFLLNVVVSRLVATQREQIAALKALGYANAAIAAHYLKLVVLIVLPGLAIGIALGDTFGGLFVGLYGEFFRFPVFEHRIAPWLLTASAFIAFATAALGTINATAATLRLAPAEAMRPPAPGRYRRTWSERAMAALRLGEMSPSLRMILRNMERRPLRTVLSIGGVAAALAIVVMGNFVRDSVDVIVDSTFNVAMRGDVIVWMAEPVSDVVRYEIARLPGALQVESGRNVPVRFINGHRSERGAIQGYAAQPMLQRIVDIEQREALPATDGVVMTDRLAAKLGLRIGDRVWVETLEGRRVLRRMPLVATVREMMGLNAYMERRALNRWLGEDDLATQFSVKTLRGSEPALLDAIKRMPRVAGAFSKATLWRNMQDITARNIRITSTALTLFATIIAVGVVYNNARIALSERTWELASLRVLGFTRAEVSALLLGEMAISIAIALPLGMCLGLLLVHMFTGLLRSDQFMFPVTILPRTYAWAALSVVAAGLASALVVRRRIDRLDMVAALKTRE
jgi:putative ABC transport system permease protein